MPKSKANDGQVFVKEGELLPCSVFLMLIKILKANMDIRTILIVVYSANMMLQIRESVSSEFCDRVELLSPSALQSKGGMSRAG